MMYFHSLFFDANQYYVNCIADLCKLEKGDFNMI